LWTCFKRKPYGFEDAIELAIDLVIPKPQDSVPQLSQYPIAHAIPATMIIVSVLMSVGFDDKPRLAAFKVHDVVGNR